MMMKTPRIEEKIRQDYLLWERVAATVRPLRLESVRQQKIKTFEPAKLHEKCSGEMPKKISSDLDVIEPDKQPIKATSPSFNSPRNVLSHSTLPSMDVKSRKKISRGQVKMEARLDLHGLDSARAYTLLLQFISQAVRMGKKHVLVITGKGNSARYGKTQAGENQGGVLRQAVPLWLETAPFRPYVSAVEEAVRHHGGSGALYVRLRRQKANLL